MNMDPKHCLSSSYLYFFTWENCLNMWELWEVALTSEGPDNPPEADWAVFRGRGGGEMAREGSTGGDTVAVEAAVSSGR